MNEAIRIAIVVVALLAYTAGVFYLLRPMLMRGFPKLSAYDKLKALQSVFEELNAIFERLVALASEQGGKSPEDARRDLRLLEYESFKATAMELGLSEEDSVLASIGAHPLYAYQYAIVKYVLGEDVPEL